MWSCEYWSNSSLYSETFQTVRLKRMTWIRNSYILFDSFYRLSAECETNRDIRHMFNYSIRLSVELLLVQQDFTRTCDDIIDLFSWQIQSKKDVNIQWNHVLTRVVRLLMVVYIIVIVMSLVSCRRLFIFSRNRNKKICDKKRQYHHRLNN
jgi:hypothetical protein